MTKKIRVFEATTFDPWLNLATEDWILRDLEPDTHVLYLWRNENTVVIGRFQNPWTECNTAKMEADGIKLARRQSGGGAVFHDLGNTNFTFLNSKSQYDKGQNNQIILKALEQFDIKAKASGRNDLVVETIDGDKKFSGSAFKETKDNAFHHGTLLIDADLSKLSQYLNPNKKKLESKGIKSVRARVANLKEINSSLTHESLSEAIISEFFNYHQMECEVEKLDHDFVTSIPALNNYYEKLKDWQWRFGETPKFTHFLEERLKMGQVEVHMNSHKGLVTDCKIFSDSLHPQMIECLTESLKDQTYDKDGVTKACASVKVELPMIEDYVNDFEKWLIQQIS